TTQALSDAELLRHRAVAVADSAQRMAPTTVNLLPGQDVLTVSSMQHKIEALLRCMGCGFVPEPMVREHIAAGHLVVRPVQRGARPPTLGYAWRTPSAATPGAARKPQLGHALHWWLNQLESPTTRVALLERHGQVPLAGM
ncbi:MAG: LysR substrate-binding domain-containing protein, partial [Burkholderiaceae bacterium]